ncbi:MAG: ParB/RepB/Spo0J family partition protein [Granulosicoccus sp.]
MAKKPRMGRNLNALLGSAAREKPEDKAVSGAQDSAVGPTDKTDNPDAQNDQTFDDASIASPDVDPRGNTNAIAAENLQTSAEDIHPGDRLLSVEIEKIRRGTYQPRRLFDPDLLNELAESIKAQGMIQPVIIRACADGYELVAGERRWRAAQIAGLDRIPAILRDMEDQSVAAVSLIENIQRKDLNPLEEAAAFARLCDEFGMTHKAVAESVGRSRASVSNLLRLLDLHEEVKELVDRAELEMGHARALLGAPTQKQPDIARTIIKQGMSVRAVETYIRSLDEDGTDPAESADKPVVDPDIDRLRQKLSETLGASVQIQHKTSGAGKLQITYSSVSELQGILAHIK